jgi:hypothetical protein
VWLGFCSVEVAPSPKTHAKVGVPVQLEGVAVEVKLTASGAVPDEGAAVAVQEREQTGAVVTVTVPDFVQFVPWMLAVRAQL